MRTTYRGINRAQALRQYREMLEHEKLKAEKKQSKLKRWLARPWLDILTFRSKN